MENTIKETLNMPIKELGLSFRLYFNLKRSGIHTVGDLISLEERDLFSMKYIWEEQIEEIKEKLSSFECYNLRLGMNELKAMASLNEQMEQKAKQAESMVSITKANRDRLLDLNQRKQAALEELQALSEEQKRLEAENELLDGQIAQVAETLGLRNVNINNSGMSNGGRHIR